MNDNPKSNLEQCVDKIRTIIHKCNGHQKLESYYQSLAKAVDNQKESNVYWNRARLEGEKFEDTWKGVRPALKQLLEAEKVNK